MPSRKFRPNASDGDGFFSSVQALLGFGVSQV